MFTRQLAMFTITATICCGCVPRFAYVVDSEDDSVSVYAIEAGTGRLRSLGYYPTGSHPSGIAFQLDGKFAFVANQGTGGNGSVSAFAVDSVRGSLQRLDADMVTPGSRTIRPDPPLVRWRCMAHFSTWLTTASFRAGWARFGLCGRRGHWRADSGPGTRCKRRRQSHGHRVG